MSNDDVAREINELLGIGEHEPDFGPDPIKVLLDKHYPPISVGTGLAKRLRDAAYGVDDPRPIMLEAAAALEVPLPADLVTLVAASREWLIHNATESCDPVARLCDAIEALSRPAEGTENDPHPEFIRGYLAAADDLEKPYPPDISFLPRRQRKKSKRRLRRWAGI